MGVNSKLLGFLETNRDDFELDVLQRMGLTLVEFHRHGCLPCIQFEPILEQLADFNLSRCTMVRQVVSGMEDDYFSQKYNFPGEPTCALFLDGELLGTVTGGMSRLELLVDQLNQIIQKAVQDPERGPRLMGKLTGTTFRADGPSQLAILRQAMTP